MKPYANYTHLVGALYSNNEDPDRWRPKKPKKRRQNHEYIEQIILVSWLTKNGVLHYHIPNGMRSNAIEGAKFRRLGVKRGVPDICVPLARSSRHGLYIELKRKEGGTLTFEQKEWLEKLNNEGYLAVTCHGADEAIRIVNRYLGKSLDLPPGSL